MYWSFSSLSVSRSLEPKWIRMAKRWICWKTRLAFSRSRIMAMFWSFASWAPTIYLNSSKECHAFDFILSSHFRSISATISSLCLFFSTSLLMNLINRRSQSFLPFSPWMAEKTRSKTFWSRHSLLMLETNSERCLMSANACLSWTRRSGAVIAIVEEWRCCSAAARDSRSVLTIA